jgi:hypothetical protein
MPDQPNGFESGDLYCFPAGPLSDGRFKYIPGSPTLETASLTASPVGAQLSLQAVWQATPEALRAAESTIRARYSDAGSVHLQPVEFSNATASLQVELPDGSYTIGPNPTSGLGSQRVVFNDRLTAAEKAAAISAFKGQSGILTLTYQGRFDTRESSTVKISGDLAADLKRLAPNQPEESSGGGWFRKKKDPDPPPDLAACAAAIDSAISSRRLELTRVDTPHVSEATKRKADSAVRDKVARLLFDKLLQMGADAVYVNSFPITWEIPESEDVSFQISRSADLGNWLGRNGGSRLVSEVSAPIGEPRR